MNGLLISPPLTWQRGKNIGDYIQSLAQEQYWDKIDCYVYRDWMKTFCSKEKVNLIMNGWFMWNADQFPPSDSINPFFISFHLSPSISDKILSNDEALAYLKKHEPIGCRDIDTQKMLESKGIQAYFSGCLTTTLGLKYHHEKKTESVLFVEPFNPLCVIRIRQFVPRAIKAFCYMLKNWNIVKILSKRTVFERQTPIAKLSKRLAKLLTTAMFYHYYSSLFDDETLLKASFISQIIRTDGVSEKQKLDIARDYIQRYADAPLVITSRLHAAFPSMAIGTPTIYINADVFYDNKYRPAGRLEGNLELMNYYTWTEGGFVPGPDNNIKLNGEKINPNSIIINSERFNYIKNSLIENTMNFVKSCR